MNIIYVCREISPFTGGGIGTYIGNVVKGMVRSGHSVTVVTDFMGNAPENPNTLFPGVRFIIPNVYDAKRLSDFMSEHQAYASRVYETLLKLAAEERFDIVEFPEFRGEGFLCIRAKRTLGQFLHSKLIVKCHTPFSLIREINEDYFLQPRHEMDIFMEDYSVEHADLVTSPSKSLRDYFLKRTNRKDIYICPYPLELPTQSIGEVKIERDRKLVRFFGSIQPRKGVDHFVDAAVKLLKAGLDFRFQIVGGERNQSILWTEYSQLLKERIPEEFKNSIEFCGAVDADRIPDMMAETGVVLLPSRWENWANVCLEAMSFGCVVVASKEGGMGEMIEDGISGFHLDPKDIEATVDRLKKIYELTNDDVSEISDSARKRAVHLCDPDKTLRRIESNYQLEIPRSKWLQTDIDDAPKPLVSVVIPFYNQIATLSETIDSVQASDYQQLEIIVVNDGSDHPQAMGLLDEVQQQENVRCLHQENKGLSGARNLGFQEARGDFVLPLDSDDTIQPDYISKAVKFLMLHSEVSYIGSYAQNFGAFDGVYSPLGTVKPLMALQNTDIKCSGVFRKTAFGDGYDPVLYSYEDWDFLIGINERGGIGEVIPEPLFNYRRDFRSMVFSTANHQKAHLMQYMFKKHERYWAEGMASISRMLLRLWKEEEFDREYSSVELVQVYYGVDGILSEEHSSLLTTPRGQWRTLRFKLPKVGNITSLRIDPRASDGRVKIRKIVLEQSVSGLKLLNCQSQETFAGVLVTGTASGGWSEDSLLVESYGNDPQVILAGFNTNGEVFDLYIDLCIDPV